MISIYLVTNLFPYDGEASETLEVWRGSQTSHDVHRDWFKDIGFTVEPVLDLWPHVSCIADMDTYYKLNLSGFIKSIQASEGVSPADHRIKHFDADMH